MPLALVVGASGAGKDTLIAQSRLTLGAEPRFVFVRRVVTRPAMAGAEDHEVMDERAFLQASARGAFALEWQAHGLRYGLPIGIDQDLAAGRVVVANGSRHALATAAAKYPGTVAMVVKADHATRMARLAARGRETAEQMAQRLARDAVDLPATVPTIEIDNSGALVEGVAAFVAALRGLGSAAGGSRVAAAGLSQ